MHNHTCPGCGHPFDCEVPFCAGIRLMMCDGCFDATAKIVPHPDGYQQVVDYVREQDAATHEAGRV